MVRAKHPVMVVCRIYTAYPFTVAGKLRFTEKWISGKKNQGEYFNYGSDNTEGRRGLLFW